MAEKATIMVLEVDLQCTRCYKKVKKVLCKFPQIRDQVYNEKENRVTITVVCCNPERMRDKLCCKGGGSIKSIEIKEAPIPVVEVPTPENEKVNPNQTPLSNATAQPTPILPVHVPVTKPVNVVPNPVPFVYLPGYPMWICCRECYRGYTGPCFHGGYGGCYGGRPIYDSYGGGWSCHTYTSRCYYFSEENASGCRIM